VSLPRPNKKLPESAFEPGTNRGGEAWHFRPGSTFSTFRQCHFRVAQRGGGVHHSRFFIDSNFKCGGQGSGHGHGGVIFGFNRLRKFVKLQPAHPSPPLLERFEGGADGVEISGTGIGLAIVHKGMERMGGKVWVESSSDAGSVLLQYQGNE